MPQEPLFSRDEILSLISELDAAELEGIDKKSLTPLYDEILVSGEGSRVKDREGKVYLDCTSQAWSLNIGFANPDIAMAVSEQVSRLTHVRYGFPTIPRIKLINKLLEIAPSGLTKVCFNNSGGGQALEAAMKLAMINKSSTKPEAQMFVTFWRGYHGSSIATTTLSQRFAGLMRYRPWGLDRVMKVPYPYCYRCPVGQEGRTSCKLQCLDLIATTIEYGSTDRIAGLIIEPMQGPGGHIPTPKGFLQDLKKICEDNEIYLIYDEAQTFTRIGWWTAAEYYGVSPHMMGLTKSLGGGIPIGATLAAEELLGFTPAEEHTTFGSSPIMFASSLVYLHYVERANLLENTRKMGEYLTAGLKKIQNTSDIGNYIGDIRCPGLFIGVELVEDRDTKKPANGLMMDTVEAANERGIIFGEMAPIISDQEGLFRNVLKIKPPMIITKEDCDFILEIFEESVEEATDYL
ncbi:MAG: aspartate aminotransferase family protein [Candidatus Hodarchaeota archaeon]